MVLLIFQNANCVETQLNSKHTTNTQDSVQKVVHEKVLKNLDEQTSYRNITN